MTDRAKAMASLRKLAMFGPGATIEGSSATYANVLLRARDALAKLGALLPDRTLCAELDALRINLEQRQTMLELVHDALLERPTHQQAEGSRIARERRDAENRGDPSEDPGR